MPTCAAKQGYVLKLQCPSDRALHINAHGKVSAEDMSLARKYLKDILYIKIFKRETDLELNWDGS